MGMQRLDAGTNVPLVPSFTSYVIYLHGICVEHA